MIEITPNEDDNAFLELQSEELALTKEQVVAMLIRKARKAYEKPAAGPWLARGAEAFDPIDPTRQFEENARLESERQRQLELAEKRAKLQAELAALDGEMLSTESITEGARQMMTGEYPEFDDPNRPDEFDESLIPADPVQIVEHHSHGTVIAPPRNSGVGSLTAPAGVRADLRGRGHVMGDPTGNIVRRNFSHLGMG